MRGTLTWPNLRRLFGRPLDMDWNFRIGSQRFQFLNVIVKNNGGVLQHAFSQNFFAQTRSPYPPVCDLFRNIAPLGAFTNTPTLGAGTGYAGGLGISANLIAFDTEPIDVSLPYMGQVVLSHYDGNNTRVVPLAGYFAVTVLGDASKKFIIGIWNASTGAAVNITTTWLPSGKQAHFTWFGFL